MKAVHTELHRSHDPQFFLVRGVVRRTTEQPERADRLLAGLKAGRHQLVEPTVFGQGPRARVHSAEYLGFLAEALGGLVRARRCRLGNDRQHAPRPQCRDLSHPHRRPSRLAYRRHRLSDRTRHLGRRLCRDGCRGDRGSTGAWTARTRPTRSVVRRAITPIATSPAASASSTTARSRPPICGSAHERVAILDVDVHHGNGTQGIFYERGDVLTVSIHADPASFYPFVWGYAHERGAGAGLGANLNIPLADRHRRRRLSAGAWHGESDDRGVRAGRAGGRARPRCVGARSAGRPRGDHATDSGASVRRSRALGLPTVFVQEGGYLSDILGANLTAALAGFEEAR